jgi:hypothetical protein
LISVKAEYSSGQCVADFVTALMAAPVNPLCVTS